MQRISVRKDLKRFGVEALCLLMVLYGAPVQALQQSGAVVARDTETSSEASAREGFAEGVGTAITSAADAGAEVAKSLVGQPWTDALAILLATGAGEEAPPFLTDAVAGPDDTRFDAVPPMPPGFRQSQSQTRRAGIPGRSASPEALLASKNHLEAIPLLGGWNLFSIPEEPADPNPAVVLAPIAGSFDRVFAYDACDPVDPWKLYDPADAAASDLLDLDPTQGFWIDATAPVSLPSDGTLAPTTSWQLCTGWNLIGYPAGEARHIRNALQSIEGKYIRAFGFDLADPADPWEIWDALAPDWANDLGFLRPGFGYWVLVTEDVTLEIANEAAAPTVAINSPTDLAVVTAPTEIRGTVQSKILQSWNLDYRLVGESEWVQLASGAFPVSNAPLATFDPTLLLNGLYEIRLEATDLAGMAVEETIAVSVEGQMKIGHFTLTYTDLAIPLSGLDIEVLRTYDTRQRQLEGDFGRGWTLDIRQGSYRNNRPPGEGWQILDPGGPFSLPCTQVSETKSHITTIRLSDREIYRFRLRLVEPAVVIGGCFATAQFDFLDGPLVGTTLDILGNTEVIYRNAADDVIDSDTLEIYEPQNVRLVTEDGRIFDFDLEDGVERIEDATGSSLQVSAAGITHSSGFSIDFERDAEGRIDRIVDPLGQERVYGYDAAGDLVTFVDEGGSLSRYTYDDDHFLIEIEDARGAKPVRNDYDDEGRLVSTTDAQGRTTLLEHDLDNRREVVTDRVGEARVFDYDARGNLVREIDAEGGITQRVFDGRDNVLSVTDPEGGVTGYEYSASNRLTRKVSPLGHATLYEYDGRGNLTAIEDPKGQRLVSTYDGENNLLSTTDALGNTVRFTYDGSGNQTSATDSLGNVTTWEYDGNGNPVREVDPLGHEILRTFDALGRMVTETQSRTLHDGTTADETLTWEYDPYGRVSLITFPDDTSRASTFDLLGSPLTITDELGRTTTYTYDLSGRRTAIQHPDGTSETRSYDAAGRIVASVDRAGRSTSIDYDGNGRPLATTHPDGTVVSQTWDRAGRLLTVTNGRGNTTTYTYDAAGNQVRVTDPLGNTHETTYDDNSNPVTSVDALGRVTEFVYDAGDRLVRVDHPDGTATQFVYDGEAQRTEVIDPAGRSMRFGYDALGRLAQVTDPAGEVTTYGWDELGNQVSQTDTLGRTVSMLYDSRGSLVERILPDGASERFDYRADGSVASRTAPDGGVTRFDYDAAGRVVTRTLPDGSQHTFTYTATGHRATATDASGTTTYAYDSRDRLTVKTDPAGRELRYTWDGAGNRTSMTASVAGGSWTTSYSWDAAERLATVTDPTGAVVSHGYDAVGNRTSLAFPSGVTTSTSFDARNRLLDLTTRDGAGTALESFAYTLDALGQRTRIDEADGTVRSYDYDALLRVVEERITDAAGLSQRTESLVYDLVGNRQSRTVDVGAGPEVTTYTYDTRDRLVTAGTEGYTWDDAGRLVARTDGGATSSYAWDGLDRLAAVTLDDGTVVRTTYDVDGNRVARESESPSGEIERIEYLVDTTAPLSHVVAEIQDGLVGAVYVRGDELLSVLRPTSGEQRFFHADGLGSIRALTDPAGVVTDTYDYSLFGELLEHVGDDVQPYRFTGEPFDATVGLAYHRARWLDPAVGRFVSTDPFSGRITDPTSLHRYLYAHADPVNQIDPTGLFSVGSSITAAGITNIISTGVGIFNTAFRIYRAAEIIRDVLDYAVLIRKIIKALSAPTPEGAMAAFLGELEQVLTPDDISTMGDAFREMADRVGPHWEEMAQAIGRNSASIAGQSVAAVKRDLPTWTKLEAAGRLSFILYAPTGPGKRTGDIPIKVNRKTEMRISATGGRLFGFGVRTSKKPKPLGNSTQIFRIDWWEGELDLHYHIRSKTPGTTIWKP